MLGFQAALVVYVLSSFIKEQTGLSDVGVFYLLASLAAILVLLNLHYLIKKYGKTKVFLIFLLFKMFSLIGAGIFFYDQIAVIFVVWSLMSGAIMWVCLDVVVENFSDDNTTGETRGLQLTIMNAGFVFSPIIAVWILDRFGFRWVFFSAAVLVFLATLLVFVCFQKNKS